MILTTVVVVIFYFRKWTIYKFAGKIYKLLACKRALFANIAYIFSIKVKKV